jgi:hypothetical protein
MIIYPSYLAGHPRFTLSLEDEVSIDPGNVKEVDNARFELYSIEMVIG